MNSVLPFPPVVPSPSVFRAISSLKPLSPFIAFLPLSSPSCTSLLSYHCPFRIPPISFTSIPFSTLLHSCPFLHHRVLLFLPTTPFSFHISSIPFPKAPGPTLLRSRPFHRHRVLSFPLPFTPLSLLPLFLHLMFPFTVPPPRQTLPSSPFLSRFLPFHSIL